MSDPAVVAPLDQSTAPDTANSFPTDSQFSDPAANSGVIGVRHLPP